MSQGNRLSVNQSSYLNQGNDFFVAVNFSTKEGTIISFQMCAVSIGNSFQSRCVKQRSLLYPNAVNNSFSTSHSFISHR